LEFFLAFIFLSDKEQKVRKVERSGGFYVKYYDLIQYFYSMPEIKVERK
jgi:hypothetical protein